MAYRPLRSRSFTCNDTAPTDIYTLSLHDALPISPLGLILCATKNEEHVELMQLEESNIKIAEYLTKLPDMKLLESKRSEEHTSELQSRPHLVCRLLLEKKK